MTSSKLYLGYIVDSIKLVGNINTLLTHHITIHHSKVSYIKAISIHHIKWVSLDYFITHHKTTLTETQ